uniref:Uncharacterized protein n=1 Tax=Arundo donax TaxID=35708 RepID=A0A0A8ZVR4_ARUDO
MLTSLSFVLAFIQELLWKILGCFEFRHCKLISKGTSTLKVKYV